MSSGIMWIWIGAIVGGVLGLAGGIVGTYFSIKNTSGPRERAFMVKCAVVVWIFVAFFIVLVLFLPRPLKWLPVIPYAVALPLYIRWGNKTQQRIRTDEARARDGGEQEPPVDTSDEP